MKNNLLSSGGGSAAAPPAAWSGSLALLRVLIPLASTWLSQPLVLWCCLRLLILVFATVVVIGGGFEIKIIFKIKYFIKYFKILSTFFDI
jgi:hypothetical protein